MDGGGSISRQKLQKRGHERLAPGKLGQGIQGGGYQIRFGSSFAGAGFLPKVTNALCILAGLEVQGSVTNRCARKDADVQSSVGRQCVLHLLTFFQYSSTGRL